jgi:hypothetical protein
MGEPGAFRLASRIAPSPRLLRAKQAHIQCSDCTLDPEEAMMWQLSFLDFALIGTVLIILVFWAAAIANLYS